MDRELLALTEGPALPAQPSLYLTVLFFLGTTIILLAPVLALCGMCDPIEDDRNRGPRPYVTHTVAEPAGPQISNAAGRKKPKTPQNGTAQPEMPQRRPSNGVPTRPAAPGPSNPYPGSFAGAHLVPANISPLLSSHVKYMFYVTYFPFNLILHAKNINWWLGQWFRSLISCLVLSFLSASVVADFIFLLVCFVLLVFTPCRLIIVCNGFQNLVANMYAKKS
jgi:hypothetical protein